MTKRIVIVCPVLDDWPSFLQLVDQLAQVFVNNTEISLRIVAVDDGSSSAPAERTIPLPEGCRIEQITVMHLAVNLGHQRAIATGLSRVCKMDDVDAVVVMDSDGEDRPQDAAALCAAGDRFPGAVVLARRASRSESRIFKFGYRGYKMVFRLLTGRTINFGNFSFLPISAARRLVYMPELWNHLPAAVVRSRLRSVSIPVHRGTRYAGKSRMNLPSLVVLGMSAMSVYIDLIFVRVLLVASLIAFCSVIGMIIIVAIRTLTDLAIPGWASTVFGDLLVVLMQALVVIIATGLLVLSARSQRPIIPVVDSPVFIVAQSRLDLGPLDALETSFAPAGSNAE